MRLKNTWTVSQGHQSRKTTPSQFSSVRPNYPAIEQNRRKKVKAWCWRMNERQSSYWSHTYVYAKMKEKKPQRWLNSHEISSNHIIFFSLDSLILENVRLAISFHVCSEAIIVQCWCIVHVAIDYNDPTSIQKTRKIEIISLLFKSGLLWDQH